MMYQHVNNIVNILVLATINSLRPYIMIGTYIWACNSLTQKPVKMKLGIHMYFNEYTNIIEVNIVVNNVVLVK